VDGVEEIPADTVDAWATLVNTLLETFHFASVPVTIEAAPEAWEAMKVHYKQIVERRLAELQDVTTYAARWNEQAWRMFTPIPTR
jgi:hypothetical protein